MNRSNRRLVGWTLPLVAVAVTVAAAGCRRLPADAAAEAASAAGDPRIVSLSPAITRALVDLGLADRVVGRTPFCLAVDRSIPVVGDQQHVDYERLVRIGPTHVLVQPPSTGIDPRLAAVAKERQWRLGQWRLENVEDIRELVESLPAVVAPDPGPLRARLDGASAELSERLARCLVPTGEADSLWRGTTLLVCGLEPVTIFGAGTYLDEMLVALGGRNASSAAGWATLSMEDVARLDPAAIILVHETTLRDRDGTDRLLGPLAALDVTAVREGRLAVLDEPDAFLPSTGLPAVARRLESILRRFAEPAS